MQDPEITTISIYRTDKKKLRAIAIAKDLRDLKNHPSMREAVHHVLKENQILVTFPDEEKADYVRLICRRKGIDLAGYITDNFEWDGQIECLSAFNESDKITFETCEGCEYIETCPDAVKEKKKARGRS